MSTSGTCRICHGGCSLLSGSDTPDSWGQLSQKSRVLSMRKHMSTHVQGMQEQAAGPIQQSQQVSSIPMLEPGQADPCYVDILSRTLKSELKRPGRERERERGEGVRMGRVTHPILSPPAPFRITHRKQASKQTNKQTKTKQNVHMPTCR
jgi:hypothetical protein